MRPRKIFQEKYCQISRTQEQIKHVKDNLSRKTCSSYGRVSELVKNLLKENLLVCTALKKYLTSLIQTDLIHIRSTSQALIDVTNILTF